MAFHLPLVYREVHRNSQIVERGDIWQQEDALGTGKDLEDIFWRKLEIVA
jgi:hypothetical protein